MKNKIDNSLENKMSKIYCTKPSIAELEICYATDSVTNGWGEQCVMAALFKQEI